MKSRRTKFSVNQLQSLSSALVARAELAAKMGQQFGGDRNLYTALGYKHSLTFEDYFTQYSRQEIAKAIIDRPVKATWQGPLELIETNEPEDTEFEKAWKDLNRKLGLKTRLARVDKLTGIGEYGILLLGLSDVSSPEQMIRPAKKNVKLMYVKPFSQKTASIAKYENDSKNPRFGLPLLYELQLQDPATKASTLINVHHSRVIHVVDGNLESEIFGTPRLKSVFNRLMDIEKLVGGDAEMFWKGARPGYHGKVSPDYSITTDVKEELNEQLDEYENGLRRFLINEGIDIEALQQQIADPSSHLDVHLKLISSDTGIPLRVLSGSERGELASSEDRAEWLTYVQSRREEQAEPQILRLFIDRLIELGCLPTPSRDYMVKWADLFAVSEKARVEIGKSRAASLREYTANPTALGIIPPSVFMMKFLGFTSDDMELVEKMRDEEMDEEVNKLAKVKEKLGDKQEPFGDRTKAQQGTPKEPRKPTSDNPRKQRKSV